MKSIDYYQNGREQTYLKHFFLERYLERVGFNICSFKDDFVYVDGFSGPWKLFIDPTGWTGFGLQQITPILQHRPGEVIVNFMFDFINRRFSVSFDDLFGGPGWNSSMSENETIQLYCERMKVAGQFNHVTSTRILKPTVDRTYFYLIYGTRHWKGLLEFRDVEKRFVREQERVRLTAKQRRRVEKTGQSELFSEPSISTSSRSLYEERQNNIQNAIDRLKELIRTNQRIKYEDILGSLLELPLVWQSDVNELIMSLRGTELDIEGLKPRERTPKRRHVIVRKQGV